MSDGQPPVWRYEVRLSPTLAQWGWAVALAVAAWLLVNRVVESGQGVVHGIAGFVLYALLIGYLCFLRSQWSTLEGHGQEVHFLKERLPRANLRIELLDWQRLGARGAVIRLSSETFRLRLGVKARATQAGGSAHGCDAQISPSDADALLEHLAPDGSLRLVERPPSPAGSSSRARTLAGIAPWLLTMALIAAFGVVTGVYFPDFARSASGRLVIQTVIMGGIAAGLVVTTTGWHERTGTFRPREEDIAALRVVKPTGATGRPTFGRSAANMTTWMAGSWLVAAALFAPLYGISSIFRHYVDIPACTADCTSRGLTFGDYRSSKQGSYCVCKGEQAEFTSRVSYNVTGGHGFWHGLTDFLVRATAVIGGTLLWIAGLFGAAVAISAKLKRR